MNWAPSLAVLLLALLWAELLVRYEHKVIAALAWMYARYRWFR